MRGCNRGGDLGFMVSREEDEEEENGGDGSGAAVMMVVMNLETGSKRHRDRDLKANRQPGSNAVIAMPSKPYASRSAVVKEEVSEVVVVQADDTPFLPFQIVTMARVADHRHNFFGNFFTN
ncbi:hypothetical protein LOK49_LG06G02002 [Camellia lanceoleosa]|uniref:Uncharacterized protein n=1 Tax=Camellia lanceoleosa TaxID=1840588 RepID=A0ACC0HFL9_9ERIC|nr:hypothetical protein LOK49_LG06G02002 [Camellia lanceoleosa]